MNLFRRAAGGDSRAGQVSAGMKAALIAYGLLHAALYSLLLPLWEGFDEPFHYGYVVWLAEGRGFPVLGAMPLSEELDASLRAAPGSHVVKQNLPYVVTFEEFARLAPGRRAEVRREAMRGQPEGRNRDAPGTSNYEAQQAPLAYAVLAPLDRWWRGEPLGDRVLRLRLVASGSAVLMQAFATLGLARALGLTARAAQLALFLVFSCQVFWATVAHVANDWLAVPLATASLWALVRLRDRPSCRGALVFGLLLGAGLLAKAYLLSCLWLAAAVLAWDLWRHRMPGRVAVTAVLAMAVVAGPWYGRNLWLYGNLTGAQQISAGVGVRQAIESALQIRWPAELADMARGALWTGNGSFTSFSVPTLNAVLALLMAALVLWGWTVRRGSNRDGELLVAGACLVHTGVLLCAAAVFAAYLHRSHVSAAPWHVQAMSAPLACLVAAGASRGGRPGGWLAGWLSAAAAYLVFATWWIKLFPLYGGLGGGRVALPRLWDWYLKGELEVLAQTALGNHHIILVLGSASTIVAAGLAVAVARRGTTAPQYLGVSADHAQNK